jgi:hypothetical protein
MKRMETKRAARLRWPRNFVRNVLANSTKLSADNHKRRQLKSDMHHILLDSDLACLLVSRLVLLLQNNKAFRVHREAF